MDLDISVTDTACPHHTVQVRVTNLTPRPTAYTLSINGLTWADETLAPRQTQTTNVELPRGGERAAIRVAPAGQPAGTVVRSAADCAAGRGSGQAEAPPSAPHQRSQRRPDRPMARTTPPSGRLAKTATGIAAFVTTGVLLWYGLLWPRGPYPGWTSIRRLRRLR